MSQEECNICVSAFNKSTRKKVKCPYCNYEVCSECIKTMMIENGESCPDCKKGWNKEFIKDNTTKVWFDGPYKDKRKEQMFEREKSLLQTALPVIKAKQYSEKMKKQIDELKKKIAELEAQKNHCEFELRHNTTRLRQGLELENVEEKTQVFNREIKFIKPCPVNDCRGFLSTSWKCELCETWVCKDCLEIKKSKIDEEHKCNEDNINSAKLLLKDSKPCPSCGVRIHRIEGCNAMFCVSCKTCFNWKTGQITKANSNPHFHEWAARKNKGEIKQEQNCIPYNIRILIEKNLIAKNIIKPITNSIVNRYHNIHINNTNSQYDFINKIGDLVQKIHHLREVVLPRINIRQDINSRLMELRVKYLDKEIDEKEWKRQIFLVEKKMEYDTVIYNLYDIVINVITNSILSLEKVNSQTEIDKYMDEIIEVIEYFNEHSLRTSKYYNYQSYKYIQYNPKGKIYHKAITDDERHFDFITKSIKNRKSDDDEKKE